MIQFWRFVPFLFLVSGCILSPGPRIRADIMLAKVAEADSRYIDETNDSLLLPAVEYYRGHGPKSLYAWSLYYLGRLRYNAGDYNEAILLYAQAAETHLFKSDPSFRGFVRSSLADTYGICFYDAEALQYDSLALADFRRTGNLHYERGALYNLALQHYNMHHWDIASELYADLVFVPDSLIALRAKNDLAAV